MSYNINWTPESEYTFNQNIEYLSVEWNDKTINQFLDRIEEVIDTIKKNPLLYPLYKRPDNIHKCIINERIILYYRIANENNIDLLTFWNTYQDPTSLTI